MKLEIVDLGGPVHYADFGGSGEPMVLVHGLGGSLLNWVRVAGPLAERYRVLALDLVGFGRSPLAGRSLEMTAQADLIARFVDRMAGGSAILVGNSMGGLASAITAARRPEAVSRLVLVNPALPAPPTTRRDPGVTAMFALYMTPLLNKLVLGWRARKMSAEETVRGTLALCGVDLAEVPADVLATHVELAEARRSMPWAHDALLGAARSIVVTGAQHRRFQASVLAAIRAPTLLMHGTRDRVVPLAVAQHAARLRPDFTFAVLEGAGHAPQLEIPARWLEIVLGWLGRLGG